MFLALWHPAVIGRHHQHNDVDSAHPGNHISNETFVPRHIDKAYLFTGR